MEKQRKPPENYTANFRRKRNTGSETKVGTFRTDVKIIINIDLKTKTMNNEINKVFGNHLELRVKDTFAWALSKAVVTIMKRSLEIKT